MKVEAISIREVFAPNSKKIIEVSIRADGFTVNSAAPEMSETCRLAYFPYAHAEKSFLEIKRHFIDGSFDSVEEVDGLLKEIDPMEGFGRIGGNLAFAISSAFLKALALSEGVEVYECLGKRRSDMPMPVGKISGKNSVGFSEFLMVPTRERDFSKAVSSLNSVDAGAELQPSLRTILESLSKFSTPMGLSIGIKVSAPYNLKDGVYMYPKEKLGSQEQMLFIQDVAKDYPVAYIEDPFYREDFVLPAALTNRLPTRIVAGNELYSNDLRRLDTGTKLRSTSGIVITPHEAGTITDVMSLVEKAKKNNMTVIMSCMDEADNNISAHLAAGLGCDMAKIAFSGASISKANELIRISRS